MNYMKRITLRLATLVAILAILFHCHDFSPHSLLTCLYCTFAVLSVNSLLRSSNQRPLKASRRHLFSSHSRSMADRFLLIVFFLFCIFYCLCKCFWQAGRGTPYLTTARKRHRIIDKSLLLPFACFDGCALFFYLHATFHQPP